MSDGSRTVFRLARGELSWHGPGAGGERPRHLAGEDVGLDLGQLLCAGGHVREGRAVLERSRAGFEKLGLEEMVRQLDAVLAQLPDDAGDTTGSQG